VDGFAEVQTIGEDQVDDIADDPTKQYGETAQWSRCVDRNHSHRQYSDESHPGIELTGRGFTYCHRSQVQTDDRDDHTSDGRWHQVLNPPVTHKYDDSANNGIDNTCGDDTA